jgi:hypothetical protein
MQAAAVHEHERGARTLAPIEVVQAQRIARDEPTAGGNV